MSLSDLQFDDFDLPRFAHLAAEFGNQRFGYVVTSNVDHMIRLNDDAAFRELYVQADYVLLDSRFLAHRGIARGLALCIGASINFLTGVEKRAPSWMQRAGLEWFYKLLQSPRNMAKRYFLRGPRLFGFLFGTRIELRAAAASGPQWRHRA